MDRIRAALFDHRRALAAACVALAAFSILQSLRTSPAGEPVLVAARDLASGRVVVADDLRTVRMTAAARPSHLLDLGEAVGRRVAGPVREGEPITDRRVIDPRDLSGHGSGAVLTMVRLDDTSDVVGLRVGDRVDVVASSPDDTSAAVVAEAASIALLPDPGEDGDAVTVGLVTSRQQALKITARALEGRLGILVTS